ncbi:DUF309 domain-containing protein [Mesobacillus zeae]|uniref:DUF309 domain-containing protein n=1 Tax=Mesobacillus zeae TaxID=1917180 RepID=A0A398BC09_9BACI|nr:DUF309 domain-containing protein [Mesobacillus zeae]RID87347.1 DUF309 domain-containing protein [Mesobacillus zeae]
MFPAPYIEFLVHFNCDRDFFECHEILEEHWKETEPGCKDSIWVAFILLAVSSYHYRRGNLKGAMKTHNKSSEMFMTAHTETFEKLGIDKDRLEEELEVRLSAMESGIPYRDFDIPINDKELLKKCVQECNLRNYSWGVASDLNNAAIIHKHLLRDRTDVIREREAAKKEKQK